MRKNIKNDKVIRAMAIGISAMLAATSPMTALAAENTDTPADDDSNAAAATVEKGVCYEAQEAAAGAVDAVNEAEGSASTVKDDVKTNVIAGEAGISEGKDLAQEVIKEAEKIENVENAEVEKDATLKDAKTDITNADDQLGIAEANAKLSDAELGKAEEAAGKAADTAENMKDAMQEAEQKVDDQIDQIENATTVEEANTAYDELEAAANAAEETFNTKLEEYNAAKDNYDAAKADVEKYEAAYNEAIANADANAEKAKDALDNAKAKAEALEKAVAAAKDAVDASAADAMKIAEAEEIAEKDGNLNWRNEDKLFIAIMEKYYLPKEGISGATVTRVEGKDNDDYNYFTAVYKDENGVEQTKYFNYKMDGDSEDKIVIFEKREVEVKWKEAQEENPDRYVDENNNIVSVADVAAGKEDGTIVEVNGKYVVKNEMTGNETLVSDSEITGTSKEDVTIVESTKQESWSLDEEGNLVKTVTADVTTITYTDATFTSDKSYATDAERDAAADTKRKELEEATGKEANVNETEETTYTYTASGTYIPTFTKTVNVNKEYESGYLWYEADSKKEAKDKALDWAKDKIDDDLGDYYRIGDIESDLSVSMTEEETEEYKIFGKTHTVVTDDSDYLVTGTVTATYAKVTKQTVDQSTFGSLLDDIKALFGSGQSTNEKLEEAAREVIEAAGGIFLSANWDDWSYNKATIRYVAGVKVTTDEKAKEEEATGAVAAAAEAQAKANGATGVYNVKTTGTDDIAHTTYSYTVDYLKEDSKNTESTKIATETYANAEVLTGQIIQNMNYLNNFILLTQDNADYRTFVDSAKDLTAKYDRLLTEAQNAYNNVAVAQAEVEKLQNAIKELEERKSNLGALEELKAKLEIAEANKKEAEDAKNRILEKLEEAGDLLEEVVTALTPAADDTDDDDDADEDVATVTTTGDVVNVAAAPTAASVQTIATPAQTTVPTTTTPENTVVIEEETTPLAPTVEEEKSTDTDEKAEAEQEVVAIEEEKAPLADAVDKETMSWWWWLLILLLGAAGYEMYKKHQEKKKAAEVEADKAE